MSLEAQSRSVGSSSDDHVAGVEAERVHIAKLALIFLYLGSISVGGRSVGYVRTEMVDRRGWMRVPDFLEGMSFALLLPGPMGPNLALFVGRMLGGRLAAVLSVFAYVLPGAAAILALTALTSGVERAPWMDGALRGAGAAALGLLVTICVRNFSTARAARFGLVFAGLAAIGNGLGLPLLGLLLLLGIASLYVNRPRGEGDDGQLAR